MEGQKMYIEISWLPEWAYSTLGLSKLMTRQSENNNTNDFQVSEHAIPTSVISVEVVGER